MADSTPTESTFVTELSEAPEAQRAAIKEVLLALLRDARRERQIPPLEEDRALSAIADLRAAEIPKAFSHTRPDGREWTTVLEDEGYPTSGAGEALHRCEAGYPAEYIMDEWLTAVHIAKVLTDPAYTHVGIGILSKNGNWYIVCIVAAK